MLTPSEELGLSGLRLASRVRRAFYGIPERDLIETIERMRREASRRHLMYLRDGELDTIRIMPCPMTVLPDQLKYIHFITLTLQHALKRMPELYNNDPTVRWILQLTEGEEEWLHDCWSPSHSENNPVFGRLDAVVDFIDPMWKDTLRYIEPNLGGIGGLHLTPTCESILADVVLPVLRAHDSRLQLEVAQDIRELLMQEVLDHLEAIGRRGENLCFVEPKYAGSGPDEQEALAQYFHDRHGLKVMHADPAELRLHGTEVFYDREPVTLAYRDYSVFDLIDLEKEGVDVQPMRTLFRQNRVISSMAAEFDQKSAWEVLTDPTITERYFSADERQIFRRHVVWTRLLTDRRTVLPDGNEGDLLTYVRHGRESLVLKPNRSYGGEGVTLGHLLTSREWDASLEKAIDDPERWVVQQLVKIPVSEFSVLGLDKQIHVEPFYVVMGFAPSRYGVSILARASQKQVVNVALRGGMCGVLIGHARGLHDRENARGMDFPMI